MRALVIDGYNAINKIPRLRGLMDNSLMKAREKITELAHEYKRKSGSIDRVYIVFDGRDPYRQKRETLYGTQIFSKTGKGDEKIIRLVSQLSRMHHVQVVTDDNYIRNHARVYKASVISCSKFMAFLSKRSKMPQPQKNTNKLTHDKASKINRELYKYWCGNI